MGPRPQATPCTSATGRARPGTVEVSADALALLDVLDKLLELARTASATPSQRRPAETDC